jgi:hypothetical protein
MSVYAPNLPRDRTALWREMYRELNHRQKWVIMGDFNMYEDVTDHKGGLFNPIAGEEKAAWHRLKRRLHLVDTLSSRPGHLKYSWDNQ